MQGKTLKKICALICGVVLCGSAIPCLSASAETTSDGYQQETYYEYKPGNPNPVKEYTLDTRPPATATRSGSLIITDKRPLLTPLDQKIVNVGYTGTGAIVGDNAILTCAHAFIKSNGELWDLSGLQIVNSNQSNNSGDDSCRKLVITGYHVPKQYVENNKNGVSTEGYDYAVITAKIDNGDGTYSDLSEYGHFDMGIPLDSLLNKSDTLKTVRISGFVYGAVLNDNVTYALLKTATGQVVKPNITELNPERKLKYNVLTEEGTSGAPVYMEKNYNGKAYQTIVAVHSSKHTGVKIDKMMLKFALSNPNVDDDFN